MQNLLARRATTLALCLALTAAALVVGHGGPPWP
jgi:hypothetical protein